MPCIYNRKSLAYRKHYYQLQSLPALKIKLKMTIRRLQYTLKKILKYIYVNKQKHSYEKKTTKCHWATTVYKSCVVGNRVQKRLH